MRGRTLLIAGLLTAAFAGQAAAQVGTITGSPHDLSATGVLNDEICVYCHTPHGAASTGPLWNRAATPGPFVAYDSSTIDGTILGKSGANFTPGEVSMACLSCHDGTQALDAVINSPGRGFGTPLAGAAMTAGIAVVGPDLSNDHPISIQYGGYEPVAGTPIDPDFVTDDTVNATSGLATATINGTPAWWVNTSVGGTIGRDKEDMILYTAGTEPYVECATCHDPHSGNVADPTVEVNFLRMTNASSAICLACHVK